MPPPRPYNLDPGSIMEGLQPTASTQARTRALIEAGIPSYAVAEATGVTIKSVRNWTNSNAEPRKSAAKVLDSMRLVMNELLTGGLPPEEAAMFLRSGTEPEPHHVPLEIIAEKPEIVFALADQVLEKRRQS